ncbi:MAG: glycosyltransferase involved in cell wall biosynthesis [Patiriisocius sp.]|jgi:glycosyltransferase involved in cell wall biosynthesis
MSKVSLSVIVPTYNNGKNIENSISSILEQECPLNLNIDCKIIIVDDASLDDKFNEVKDLYANHNNIKILRNKENRGPAFSRNRGLKNAKGQYISFLDADDLWTKDRLKNIFPKFQDPQIDIVTGKTQQKIAKNLAYIGYEKHNATELRWDLVGSLVLKRKIIDQGFFFDEEMRLGEDTEWRARLLKAGFKCEDIDNTTLVRWIHGSNTTLTSKFTHKEILMKILHKSINENRKNKAI